MRPKWDSLRQLRLNKHARETFEQLMETHKVVQVTIDHKQKVEEQWEYLSTYPSFVDGQRTTELTIYWAKR